MPNRAVPSSPLPFSEETNMIELKINDFSIEQIANSGQCFRINKLDAQDTWKVTAFGKVLKIKEIDETNFIFDCSFEEYENIWLDYFDLKRDYEKIKDFIMELDDPYLTEAVQYGYGLRILKQDTWEVMVSFLVSQRNNIPRIKKIIEKLCANYGDLFPSADNLADYTEEDFKALGLGYRAIYLVDIVKALVNKRLNVEYLKKLPYPKTIEYLKKFNGIGDKVANCIALFGVNKIEAFPVDVWINRIIEEQYNGDFDIGRFSEYAGIVQQYMFFYQRSLR